MLGVAFFAIDLHVKAQKRVSELNSVEESIWIPHESGVTAFFNAIKFWFIDFRQVLLM